MTDTLIDTAPPRLARPVSAAIPDNPHHGRRWLILAVLAIAQLMVVLDSTVVNIALPTAQESLGFSDGNRQWIVTGYALAFGSLLLIGGRLADLFGRKRVFIIGLGGFAVASAVGGAANGFEMLVAARAVQGAFGALLAPAALSLLTTTFTDGKERAKAFGIYGAIAGAGAAVGLLLGGFLTEYASWRWTMYVNLFFAGAAMIGGALWLRHTPADVKPRIDIPGTLTVSAGLFALVYGFSHAETAGWGSSVTIGFLVASVILLAAFAFIQTRSPHPLLPLRVVLDRTRGGAFLSMFASAIGMFGIFLFLTYYLQGSMHYSAVKTGVAFLPMVAALVFASTVVSTVLSPRVSPRILIPAGMGIAALGMVVLTGIGLDTSYVSHTLPGTMIIGLGLGTVFATAMSLATMGVHADDAGVASAAVNTVQQVGGSVGTALLNTLAATAASTFAAAHLSSSNVAELAAVHSYVVAFWWAAGAFAAGSVLTAIILRSGIPHADPDSEVLVVV
ncbi:MAG: drug resistance transporter, EmrB/QacA subfamily [Jatrophihabitantaceae bacterium]|nr:drug resistance transporter, EmrB/QacA subfamily [Jatrophihabitantaceae bacterium]